MVAFHYQQSVEKALTAFLAWKDQPVPRVHDLPALLARCRPFEPRSGFDSDARTLDVYVTAGRYPDSGPEPSAAEAQEALRMAEAVLSFVADLLPPGSPH
jgi:HEPN domain-containing protein